MKNNIVPFSDAPGPIAFIIRHAERDPIEKMVNALEPRLTPQGKTNAFNLGTMLAHLCPINIYHSPVPRCRQTAECILKGINSLNQRAEIAGYLLELGGPYITGNWDAVVAAIEKHGQTNFIRKWFDNELPGTLIMSLKQAAHVQLKILLDQLSSAQTSFLNVTHDWNIMILREYFFKLRHEEIGIPDYLDGLFAYVSDGQLFLQYHEHEVKLNISSIFI
jgi:hypothetical protein